jgi:uncharacterized protein (DUF885 family)
MIPSRIMLVVLVGCGPEVMGPVRMPVPTSPAYQEGRRGVDDPDLGALLGHHWDWALSESPIFATTVGDHRFDDRIGDDSLEGIRARRRKNRAFLAQTRGIPRDRLSPRDRVTLDLFVESLEASIAAEICAFEEWSVAVGTNPVARWNVLPQQHRVKTADDVRKLLARYRAIPASIDHSIAHLKRGLAAGRVANAESIQRSLEMVKAQLAQPLKEWPLLSPARPGAPYAAELGEVVEQGIRPAIARYAALLERDLLPRGRQGDRVGLHALADGLACYRSQIRETTALDQSPEELHALGRREMEKVHGEMRALGKRLFGTTDLRAIFQRLRSDRSLYFTSADEIEAKARAAVAAAKARLPSVFGILPRADVVVRRVPDYEAEYTHVAYYRQPHLDGSKPGEYFVNVLHPETRPRYEAAALAFHESVPGHHLQIAIAQERAELPAFRRHLELTAYIEGWALYSERLAEEMGLYESDLDRMGMLSYDSWRAARLVVDTGLHAMGWDRQAAVRYMVENTPLAENNISNEVDRYISWPGQALGYKVGQLEIFRLRRWAEAELGPRFDLRGFHDVVLGSGAVTLPVLGDQVREWVERRRRSRASATPTIRTAPTTSRATPVP